MGLHWATYVSYAAQFVGVGLLFTGLGVNRLYVSTADSHQTIGAFNMCFQTGNTASCCGAIDNGCSVGNGAITSDCSLFNSVRAFFTMSVIAGLITLFINVVSLTSLHLQGSATVWFKFAGLIGGGVCAGLAILTMILASSEKDKIYGGWNYDASFALLIVGWVLVLSSTLSFCFFARSGFVTKS